MKIAPDFQATIEPTDRLVCEAESDLQVVNVYQDNTGKYHVLSDGFARHSGGPEDVMRALSFYLHGALYKAGKTAASAA
jgi:hypothetical protein